MRAALVVIALFTGVFLAAINRYPRIDGDLSWQRWLGVIILQRGSIPRALGYETFTDRGAPWLPHEWLFSILVAVFNVNLWPLFANSIAIIAGAALAMCAWRAHLRGASPAAIALGIVFAAISLGEAFGVRAQVLAWALLSAYLLLLESETKWSYAAVAVAALWSNVHASAVLAPIMSAAWLAGLFLDEGWTKATQRALAVALLSLAAICLNPFGWDLPAYAVHLVASPFKDLIAEWRPTSFNDLAFKFGAFPILLTLCAFGIERWRDRLVFLTATVLLFEATRNIGIFGLTVMPVMAVALSRNIQIPTPDFTELRALGAFIKTPLVTVGLCFAALAAGITISDGPPNDNHALGDTVAVLQRAASPSHVFCSDYAVCSLVFTSTKDRVFLDSRADPYSDDTWLNYRKIIMLDPTWQQVLTQQGVDTIVVGISEPLTSALELSPYWKRLYRNENYEIWQRTSKTKHRLSNRTATSPT